MGKAPSVLLESFDRGKDSASYSFAGLTEEVIARSPQEVIPALERIEAAVTRGLHAAGFISYEAATGLDPALVTHPSGPLPLVWFGIFRQKRARARRRSQTAAGPHETDDWRSTVSPEEYGAAVARIREYIAAGDVYQVNYTLRRRFRFTGDPSSFYRFLCRSQEASYCAFINLGRFQLLSASPELFFRLKGGLLTVRPMKGTACRGRWREEDEESKRRLREDPKERAENLMIVDLLRNDLGIVAETGSVQVSSLFDVETLPSLHQMTSTVTARLKEGTPLTDLFRALFPSGSITGAPKKRAMEIVRELETSPRGVYTGCIGFISPKEVTDTGVCLGEDAEMERMAPNETAAGGYRKGASYEAAFSVAIRTLVLDNENGTGELGLGSGITWDSRPDAEFAECLAKGVFAMEGRPEFRLIETMLFEQVSGLFLLERHLERLQRSAAYYGFIFRAEAIRRALGRRSASLAGNHKVRLLLSRNGRFAIEIQPIHLPLTGRTIPVAFATARVDSRDPFRYHKTTCRALYNDQVANRPDCDDVLFLNEWGEVTEGATSNIVARLDGALVTPSLHCGLLPGVFREELLARGTVTERVISRRELECAEEVYLVNSVRKWRKAMLV